MAVPHSRDHGHHRAAEVKRTSRAAASGAINEAQTVDGSIAVGDAPLSVDEDDDDDADVSDSDDDSEDDSEEDSEDSDESRDEDEGARSTTVHPRESPTHGGPAAQTSFQNYVQTKSQERQNSKRPAEEDIQPECQQSTLKKRKALQDISGSNSRTNVLTVTYEPPKARLASTQNQPDQATTMALVKARPQKLRAVSTSSLLRASKSGNNWPRMQDSAEFSGATLVDQRTELNSYRKDLFNYIDMIQAGAIPVQFVKSFLGRLDIHIEQMDRTLQTIGSLHAKEKKRQSKILRLHQEAMKDHEEAGQFFTELTLPATYDP